MLRAALLSLTLVSSPAFAAAYFDAQPVTRPSHERFVARDNAWRCDEAGGSSARTEMRPALVCSSLAREVGPLGSFCAARRPFDATALETGNGRGHKFSLLR